MLYFSRPNATHAVVTSRTSMGSYDVIRIVPGASPRECPVIGGRDMFPQAKQLADERDAEHAARTS